MRKNNNMAQRNLQQDNRDGLDDKKDVWKILNKKKRTLIVFPKKIFY